MEKLNEFGSGDGVFMEDLGKELEGGELSGKLVTGELRDIEDLRELGDGAFLGASLNKESRFGHQDIQAQRRYELIKMMMQKLEAQNEIGFSDLQEVKAHLALSGRQICLLLKMDPSAWSRWSKSKSIPRHIYQALVWYVQLIDRAPQVHEPYSLEKKLLSQARESDMKFSNLKKQLEQLKTEKTDKKSDVVGELAVKVQDSFENILLKFRDQMMPQKAFEIESIKYENKKLQDKILDLQKQVLALVDRLEKNHQKNQKNTLKTQKTQTNVVGKIKNFRKNKKKSKKKSQGSRSVLKAKKALRKKGNSNVGASKKLRRSKRRR